MNSSRLLKYVLPCGLLILLVSPAAAQEASDQDKDVTELKEVVVVGSRLPGRSVQDSPVPVDVLTGDNFRTYGARDMDSLLSATVPSYNVNQQPISDAATLVRPANLRGLPSDNLLILVNGKRRHRASVITFLGTGVSDGAHAPDLAVIPAIALDRVEVLRDGASAQYGSDAIAGVMNFVLKDAPDSGRVETRWGQFYEGDGDTFNIAGNLGVPLPLPLVESGFANFSFEYKNADPTDRSVQRADAQKLIDAGNTDVRQPHAQVWGAPEFHYDYKLFGNLGLQLSKSVEIYAFGNYAQRKVEGGFFYRNPNTNEVFTDGNSLLVADLSENGLGCPVVPTNAGADYSDVALPDHCFIFHEKFPGGFTPTFGGTVRDWSAAVGIRGDVSHDNVWLDDWHYDLSAVFGQHGTDFFMTNTINPNLAGLRTDVPTNYDVGADTERDRVFNLDLSRRLDTNVFHSPLNLALGLEYREEEFEREAGEENSWKIVENLVKQGFKSASDGFPGYHPDDAVVKTDRGSYAAYLDVEADVVKDLLIGVAGRYEEYETFGDTLNGKVTTRWQATSGMAFRGSLSTGFRAPTVGQANVRNISTNIDVKDGKLANEATLPATLETVMDIGGQPLKPEKSFNVSAGTVVNVGAFSVTIDYYRVKVQDRLGTTSPIPLTPAQKEALVNEGIRNARSFGSVRYFTNAFDTTTQGVDVVATYPMETFGGDTIFTFAGNWNQTRLTTEVDPDIIHPDKVRQLEEGLPKIRFSLTADHVQGPYRLLSRLYYYDVFVDYFFAGASNAFPPIDAESRWLVDLEGSYTFKSGLTIASGAQNLFDTYPTENPNAGTWGRKYPSSSPYGFNGGFYYLRAAYAF